MGYDLIGSGKTLSMNIRAWPTILRLAIAFGWKPEGCGPSAYYPELEERTPPRTPEGRLKTYFTNDGQTVSATDAMNLAQALDRALQEGAPAMLQDDPELLEVDDPFSQKGEVCIFVSEVARFCRRGGFAIL